LEHPRQLQAVDAGEHQIEQHEVGGLAPQGLEAGVSPPRQFHGESLFFEVVLQHLGDVGLVLDDQNAFVCHCREAITTSSTMAVENHAEKPPKSPTGSRVSGPFPTLTKLLCKARKSLIRRRLRWLRTMPISGRAADWRVFHRRARK